MVPRADVRRDRVAGDVEAIADRAVRLHDRPAAGEVVAAVEPLRHPIHAGGNRPAGLRLLWLLWLLWLRRRRRRRDLLRRRIQRRLGTLLRDRPPSHAHDDDDDAELAQPGAPAS